MTFITIENLSKSFGLKTLFENLTFGLKKGDKTALIAPNGTGKSTLIKIIAGKETADSGSVTIKNRITIGYLAQQPSFDPNQTISECIAMGNSEMARAAIAYEKAVKDQAEQYNAKTEKAFEMAYAEMVRLEAWDFEHQMQQILGKLNIYQLDQSMGSLSGGEKKRVSLAFTLINQPDLLLLDEPTNHLDISMIEWLESYLDSNNISLLMVTHDRIFLDNICNHILELDRGKLYHHKGNYSYYLQKRAEREEIEAVDHAKTEQLYKKELAWMRRQPKARTSKSKSRTEAFYNTEEKLGNKSDVKELKLEMQSTRMGNKIVEFKNIDKAYSDTVILNAFSYSFSKEERIGIVGKNGAGKSTFLKILTGDVKPDSGEIITGETIVFGHYRQEGIELEEDKRVIDFLKEKAEVIKLSNGRTLSVSKFLEQFLFTPDMQYNLISKLSGGERRRLGLMMVLLQNPNFLILDEPTNDLDLQTLQQLELFLDQFGGCVIVVTHDRFFMDRIVDHLFIFEGDGNIVNYNGSYLDYRAEQTERIQFSVKKESKINTKNPQSENLPLSGLTFKEKKELSKLMKEVEELESKLMKLEENLGNGSLNSDEISKSSVEYAKISNQLEEALILWMRLEERNSN